MLEKIAKKVKLKFEHRIKQKKLYPNGNGAFDFRFRLTLTKLLRFLYRDKHVDSKVILWR